MKPKVDYHEEFEDAGQQYRLEIKSYDEPFKKNQYSMFYTRVEFFKLINEDWVNSGHINLENEWSYADCTREAGDLKKHIKHYVGE